MSNPNNHSGPSRLSAYGFGGRFEAYAAEHPGLFPARVTAQHRESYRLMTEAGERAGKLSGKFRYGAAEAADFPCVGDFVMTEPADGESAVIHALLPRRSLFVRRAAGGDSAQLVAANIDTVFITMALSEDFNLRRLERYLAVAWDSMARPVILLTKCDLCEDLAACLAAVEGVALGVDVVVTSAFDEAGIDPLLPFLVPGETLAFIGSSGVGKSTLINRLIGGEALATAATRADGRGRHTTTHRELFLLPGGALVMDTPGMRELGLESVDLGRTFADIDELAAQCRFGDCRHEREPGCAVRAAIEAGDIDEARFESYLKLRREAKYEGLNSRQIEAAKIDNMVGGLSAMKQIRDMVKDKDRRRGRG